MCLASFISVSAARAAQSGKPLRVMTFNIRYNEPKDGVNSWENRKRKVAAVIRFHKADLVGVQEALIGQLKDLEVLLPEFAWCGVGRSDGKTGGEFSAILYRKNRFKLLRNSTFWLSETPETPGKGWDASYERIVTWAEFRDKSTGRIFFHFNTHFDHIAEKARRESARLLLSRIQEIAKKTPFVVTGDFNAVESSEPYKILTARGGSSSITLKDAFYTSVNEHFGPTSTYNGFGALQPGRRIDYVFVGDGIKVFEHGALADQWDGKWASDHLPVIAEIVISGKSD